MWTSHPTVIKTMRATAEIKIDEGHNTYNTNELVKAEMTREIAKHLMENDLITIVKEASYENLFGDIIYKGYLDVIRDPNLTKVMIDEYVYEVQGKRLTHEQIEEAVLNTFPEYFI
jgi:hypothetical protein